MKHFLIALLPNLILFIFALPYLIIHIILFNNIKRNELKKLWFKLVHFINEPFLKYCKVSNFIF